MRGAKLGGRKRRAAGSSQPPAAAGPGSLGDEALLAGVRAGSEPHFNELYRRYFGRIYGFLSTRVANRADAEELAQEVFTAVFRSAGGFGERATPLSWIYGIARNTLLGHMRRGQIERARAAELSAGVLAPPAAEWSFTPEEQARQNRLGAEIERRMAALAPWQRDVFRLRHVEDLPIDEISRRTTRSADAVRSGLYRTKRMLFDAADLEGDEQ